MSRVREKRILESKSRIFNSRKGFWPLWIRAGERTARSRSPHRVNPENDRTSRNTDILGQGSLETLSRREGRSCRYSSASTPSFTGTRALMRAPVDTRNRAFKYTQGRVHIDERGGQGEEKVPAKFEARCASESVLRIPGQSSGCALTARNPAAFSPSPGVCRETATTRDRPPASNNFNGTAMEIRVPTAISG